MAQLLTLKEIAKQIDIPESSLRKYREIFEDFIPGVGSGRGRRYRKEATEIFREIRNWREDEHMPWEAITARLAQKYPINAPTSSAPDTQRTAPQLSAQPRAIQQQPHQPAAPSTAPAQVPARPRVDAAQYLRRINALGEKQVNTLNTLGTEMMSFIHSNQKVTVTEVRRVTEELNASFKKLNSLVTNSLKEQNRMLYDMATRIAGIEENYNELAKGGVKSIQVAEVKEKILAMRRKIEERDRVIEEFKKSAAILKRENSELRAFKMRHLDKAEDTIREMKAYRKTPFWKRITGSKP